MALGDTGVTEQDHGWTGRHWDRTGRCRDGTEAGLGRSGESLGDTGVIQWDWGWTDRHREELGRHWGLSPRSHPSARLKMALGDHRDPKGDLRKILNVTPRRPPNVGTA